MKGEKREGCRVERGKGGIKRKGRERGINRCNC